ncbi:peptide-methionine (S)-S-oxide reductase MsrA [Terricaulis sp.]|uniref:peptide-methionine (S)-S-oxide reductase MsrA n=1 Tax=Terricaulis sp. TaxID=2768686 RepID=UPI003783D65A
MTVSRFFAPLALALVLGACSPPPLALAQEGAVLAPAPVVDMPRSSATSQVAVLAGGCFWGVEGVFEHVRGVTRVRSGYAGGDLRRANYDAVSSGTTGHAESVEITFDPRVISYGQILQIYFSVATDPTQLNRQGPDTGTQYRGNIFYADPQQERVARAYIAQLASARTYSAPIVTRVDRLVRFVPAEDYHQNYLELHPTQPYIVRNDLPKIANLRRLFPGRYTTERAA